VKSESFLTAALSVLVFLASTQLCFVKFTSANPYDPYIYDHIQVHPIGYPKITILYPTENGSLVNSNDLTIRLKANISGALLGDIYYKPSWLSNNITVFPDENNIFLFRGENYEVHEYSGNLFFTGIPEGNQTLTITLEGEGDYTGAVPIPQEYPWDPSTGIVCYYWNSYAKYTVGFIVDTISPQVVVLDLDNRTFSASEVPLSFTVDETVSEITYCLDGQENVTITGNTTLTSLSNDEHDLVVYAADVAGNLGSSRTINFSITLFPTSLVIASSITVAVVLVGLGLLLYGIKRKR
jgi:hypothetical protein